MKIWSLFKHETLTTGHKILWKRGEIAPKSNFSSFPQYFQYMSNFRSKITYTFVKCGCLIYFSLILQTWYVEVLISRSISESPLEFEITRVDCIVCPVPPSWVHSISTSLPFVSAKQAYPWHLFMCSTQVFLWCMHTCMYTKQVCLDICICV